MWLLLASGAAIAGCPSTLFSAISDKAMGQTYETLSSASLSFNNQIEKHVSIRSGQIFEKAGELMQGARRDIYVQTWKFDHKSAPAKIFATNLAKLAHKLARTGRKTPVDIWVMVNVFGLHSPSAEKRTIEKFFASYDLDAAFVRVHVGIFAANLLAVNHVKTISIDNGVAVVTGSNISDYDDELSQFDLGFVVRGQIVHDINRDFVQIWHQHVGTDLAPKLDRQRKWAKPSGGCLPVMFARNKAYSQISTTIRQSSLNQALLDSVRNAQKTIDIMTPNLNVDAFRLAIKNAVNDKVKVRIILSKGFLSLGESLPSRGGDNLYNTTRLYRSLSDFSARGYFCRQLQVRWYSSDGSDAVKGRHRPASHAKFMVIDGKVTYFGSANMDNQSWVNSREIGLFVDSRAHAQAWLSQVFEPAFAKATLVRECGGPVERINGGPG